MVHSQQWRFHDDSHVSKKKICQFLKTCKSSVTKAYGRNKNKKLRINAHTFRPRDWNLSFAAI
jgi:hypothetical protein